MVIVVTGEGTVMVLAVMIIHVVGLQGVHHTEVAKIIHLSAHPIGEGLGGIDLGHSLILHMVAQTGSMLVDLGDVYLGVLTREAKFVDYYGAVTIMVCLLVGTAIRVRLSVCLLSKVTQFLFFRRK